MDICYASATATSSANNLTPATDDGGKKNDDAVETHHSPQRVSHHHWCSNYNIHLQYSTRTTKHTPFYTIHKSFT